MAKQYGKDSVFKTIDSLAITGDKASPEHFGRPTLKPGFQDEKLRFTCYLNHEEYRVSGNQQAIYLTPDMNSSMIFIEAALEVIADRKGKHRVQVDGAKFIEGQYIPNETVVKGFFEFYIDTKGAKLMVSNGVLEQTFLFRKPFRSQHFDGQGSLDSITLSLLSAKAWFDNLKALVYQNQMAFLGS